MGITERSALPSMLRICKVIVRTRPAILRHKRDLRCKTRVQSNRELRMKEQKTRKLTADTSRRGRKDTLERDRKPSPPKTQSHTLHSARCGVRVHSGPLHKQFCPGFIRSSHRIHGKTLLGDRLFVNKFIYGGSASTQSRSRPSGSRIFEFPDFAR